MASVKTDPSNGSTHRVVNRVSPSCRSLAVLALPLRYSVLLSTGS